MKLRRRRDVEMDRVLEAALRPGPAVERPDCPDAETLAAFSERTLAPDERGRVEAHAAACGRCQETLAALVRAVPPGPGESGWWRRAQAVFRPRWVVPLAAAATAVALYVNVRPPPPPVLGPMARSETAERAIGDAAPPPERLTSPEVPPGIARAPEMAAPSAPATAPVEEAGPAPVERHLSSPAGGGQRGGDARADRAIAAPVLEAEPVAEADQAGQRAAPPPAPVAFAPVPAEAEAPPAAAAPPGGRTGTVARRLEQVAAAEAVADAPRQFRVDPRGRLERTTDGGRSWEVQATGVTVELSASSAPSADVCWAVGARGTVVRTLDGEQWERVGFPEAADLIAVVAADGRSATVTTADGRRIATDDGGASWHPAPPR